MSFLLIQKIIIIELIDSNYKIKSIQHILLHHLLVQTFLYR